MVNNRSNYINLYPSIDALQEFKVQTGNYSAEYGGNAGANVNLQLRSGTNQFHGSVFEFLRNDNLDARGYFRPAPFSKDLLRRNQFGAVFTGPIRRDKTFFMLDYEGVRSSRESAGTNIVMTPAQRRAISPPTLASSAIRSTISPSRKHHPGQPAQSGLREPDQHYTPLPNTSGTVNYNGVTVGQLTIDQGIVRLDQYFPTKTRCSSITSIPPATFPISI